MAPGLHHHSCPRGLASSVRARQLSQATHSQYSKPSNIVLPLPAGRYHASKAEAESKLPFDAGFEAVGVIADVGEGVNGRFGIFSACTLSGAGLSCIFIQVVFTTCLAGNPCLWMAPCFFATLIRLSGTRCIKLCSTRRKQCVKGT